MIERIVVKKTLPEAYHAALMDLYRFGKDCDCPAWNTTQREIALTMVVTRPLAEPMISKCFIGGPKDLEQYRQEMLDGILDFEVGRGNWVYTYHARMEWQIPLVIKELQKDPYSRRAVIDIRDFADAVGTDPACLQNIQYFIRNGRLECSVLFRSNDACKAAFMNAYALIRLQERIAGELGVEVGCYTHRANSFHCYGKDLPLLKGYVTRLLEREDLTYYYAGEWDELMDEAKPEIAAMVEELKARGE